MAHSWKSLMQPVVAGLVTLGLLAGGVAASQVVTGADIKNGSVTTKDVKDRSLLRRDFKPGQLPSAAVGPTGPAGPAGPIGPQGPAGSDASLADVAAGGVLTGHYPDPQLAASEALQPFTFENGWHDYGLAYNPARFYKDPMGIVHLSGGIAGGTLRGYMFTLPVGYRPSGVALFPVLSTDSSGGGGNILPAVLWVFRNGQVYMQNGGSNAFVSLEGISFRAAH